MEYEITGSLLVTLDWNAFINQLGYAVGSRLKIKGRKASPDGRLTFETSAGTYVGVLKSIGCHISTEHLGGVYLKSENKTRQVRTPMHLAWMFFADSPNGERVLDATWYFESKQWVFVAPESK
jgi:hypothetical protein